MSTDVPEVELGAGTGLVLVAPDAYNGGTHVLTLSGALELIGNIGDAFNTTLELDQAADQALTKSGGNLFIGTSDAHAISFFSGGSFRGGWDAAGNFNLNSQTITASIAILSTNGLVKTSGGTGLLSVDTNTYLTTASAAATYLTIAAGETSAHAAATYETIAAAAAFETSAHAAATYLTIATAASTYWPIPSLTNTNVLYATGAATVGQTAGFTFTAGVLLTVPSLTVTDTILGTHARALIGKFTGEITLLAGDGSQNGVSLLDAVNTAGNHQTVASDARNARVFVTLQGGGNMLIGATAGAGSAVYGSQGALILEQAGTAPTSAPAIDHVVIWVDGSTGALKCRTNTATYTLAA